MSYFRRDKELYINDFIEKKIKNKEVMVLSGARQVGKTTLLEHLLDGKDHIFINLEKTRHFLAKLDQCREFSDFQDLLHDTYQFNPQKHILVIDEAQMSQQLGLFVRFMKEEWSEATIILTGSLIHELYGSNPVRRAVGRETHEELWPLTFSEFLSALSQDSLFQTLKTFELGQTITQSKHERFLEYYEKYLQVGGLPAVVSAYKNGEDYTKLRMDIYKTYEDDFVRYFSLNEVNLFRRCFEAVSANVGSPSKDTQVIRLDAPGYKKVASLFARLEKWKLIIKVDQLQIEPEKNKAYPKRYLYDVGVLNDLRLRGISHISLKDLSLPSLRTPLGGLVENALALSLKNQFADVFGLKLGSHYEIDFATKHQGKVCPIEMKLNQKFKAPFIRGLRDYLAHHALPDTQAFLYYGGPALLKPVDHVWVLPFYLADETKRMIEAGYRPEAN